MHIIHVNYAWQLKPLLLYLLILYEYNVELFSIIVNRTFLMLQVNVRHRPHSRVSIIFIFYLYFLCKNDLEIPFHKTWIILVLLQWHTGVGWSASPSHQPIASGSGVSSVRIGAINVRVVIGGLNKESVSLCMWRYHKTRH